MCLCMDTHVGKLTNEVNKWNNSKQLTPTLELTNSHKTEDDLIYTDFDIQKYLKTISSFICVCAKVCT